MENPLIQDPPRTRRGPGSPLGLHRVLEPAGVLPQAAWRLDADPAIWPDEVRVAVERLNLDAASYRQLRESTGGSAAAMRGAVLDIIAGRGKMQNPVTGSGGMLTGVVDEAGPASPLGLAAGDRIATLVSLSLTPLAVTDGLARWDGQSEQVPCAGHAILFGRSIAAVLPPDLPAALALAVLDVCGAPCPHRAGGARRAAPGPAFAGEAGPAGGGSAGLAGPGTPGASPGGGGGSPPGQQSARSWRSSAPAARAARCPRRRPAGPARARSSGWSRPRPRPPRCARPASPTRW